MDYRHWDDYWTQGYINSFGKQLEDNYRGAVELFWTKNFDDMPNNSSLLDLATGNGAVATMAVMYSTQNNKQFDVSACDIAEINKSLVTKNDELIKSRSTIKFFSRVPLEKLTFKDKSFNFLISQYGLEYSKLTESLNEASRVLKDDGTLFALCHHSGSTLISSSRIDLSAYQQALNEFNLFSGAENYLKRLHKNKLTNQDTINFNHSVNSYLENTHKNEAALELVQGLSSTIKHSANKPIKQQLKNMEKCRQVFLLAARRLENMVDAAKSEHDWEAIEGISQKCGFSDMSISPFQNEDDELIAWALKLIK